MFLAIIIIHYIIYTTTMKPKLKIIHKIIQKNSKHDIRDKIAHWYGPNIKILDTIILHIHHTKKHNHFKAILNIFGDDKYGN